MSEQRSYRPDVEGLRGVAVALVVAYHASSSRLLHGGFVGVDVFFVLSGYLITNFLVREIEDTGRLSIAGFYARRARRLLPASALVFLVTTLACIVFLSPLQQYHLAGSGSHTALYISNFWFLHQSMDYFAGAIGNNPFLHTWSLAVEEQFYLIWPVIILLGLRGRRPRQTLLAIMVLVAASSLIISVWFTRIVQPWAFFSPFARAWEFAIGGITLLVASKELRDSNRVPRVLRASASWLGFAAILGAALLQGEVGFPGWRALIPVLGTAAILHTSILEPGAAKILTLPILQWLGRLSYSWYLWHWPVLVITGIVSYGLPLHKRLYAVAFCVAGSLALAAGTHVLVENPIRFSRYLAPRPTLSLALAGFVTVLTAGTAIVWERSTFRSGHSFERRFFASLEARSAAKDTCPGIGFLGTKVAECVSGDSASNVSVVLFGDSHAGQWKPAFEAIAKERKWRLVLINKPACPTAQVTILSVALKRPYTECDIWREAALKRIVQMHPAAVVIANRQLQTFVAGTVGAVNTWRYASRRTFEKLDSAGIQTIVLRDTPSPKFDIPNCLAGDVSWWARKHAPMENPCTLDRAAALNDEMFRAEREAAAGLRHLSLVDLSDLFCDGGVCPPIRNGLIVYRDDSHIDAKFALSLAPALAERFVPLIWNEKWAALPENR